MSVFAGQINQLFAGLKKGKKSLQSIKEIWLILCSSLHRGTVVFYLFVLMGFTVKQLIHYSMWRVSRPFVLYCSCVCGGHSCAGGERPCWRRGFHPLLWYLDHRQQLWELQRVLLQRRLLQRKQSHSDWEDEVGRHVARAVQHGGQQRRWRLQRDHKEAEEGGRREISLWSGENF